MFNFIKKLIVYKFLLTPMDADNIAPINVCFVKNRIKSSQQYVTEYKNELKKNLDEDMSDLSIGFYKTIYLDFVKNILNTDGTIFDREFAGDTMNSFETIANKDGTCGKNKDERYRYFPFAKWPKYIQNYNKTYHCLANFWILPLVVGRTLNGKFNKGSNKSCGDYMDKFLIKLKSDFKGFTACYPKYTANIKSFESFCNIHFLVGSFVDDNYEPIIYSDRDSKYIVKFIKNALKKRAKKIANSKYNELFKYYKYIIR